MYQPRCPRCHRCEGYGCHCTEEEMAEWAKGWEGGPWVFLALMVVPLLIIILCIHFNVWR